MQRNRFTQTITLGDRLADEAERLRQKAPHSAGRQTARAPFAEISPVRDRLADQRMALVSGPANATGECTRPAPWLPPKTMYPLGERTSRSRAIRRLNWSGCATAKPRYRVA